MKFFICIVITYILYIIAIQIFKNQNATILGFYVVFISFMLYFEMLNKIGKLYCKISC